MAYNNLTSRTDAAALIPEEVSKEMLGKAVEDSAAVSYTHLTLPTILLV